MQTARSQDGTEIAWHLSGAGPPLVVVHGSGAANPRAWIGVMPGLERRFSVYAVDRRGHGASSDSPEYALEREFEDIAAVVEAAADHPAAGGRVHLLGHSFGALVALEAGRLTRKLGRLVLYEPAIALPGRRVYPEGVIERMQALLDAGDREAALTMLYREVAELPVWEMRLRAAGTMVREARGEEGYRFQAQRFKDLAAPTLLLLGSKTLGILREATKALDRALPNGRVAVLEGQQHTAMYTAPDLFLDRVLSFLCEEG